MKILYVTEFFPPDIFGGGEISAYALAREMSRKHEVHVLTSSLQGEKGEEVVDGMRVFRSMRGHSPRSFIGNLKRSIIFAASMRAKVKDMHARHKYDIVHALNTTTISGLSAIKGVPRVATINSYVNTCPKGNMFYKDTKACEITCNFSTMVDCVAHSEVLGVVRVSPLIKANPLTYPLLYTDYQKRLNALDGADQLIAVSSSVRDYLSRYGHPGAEVIPSIVEFSRTASGHMPSSAKKMEGKFIVSSLSNIEKQKGISLILDAALRLKDETDIIFAITGTGSMEEEYRQVCQERGLSNVIFLGKIDHKVIPQLYDMSDIILQTSIYPEPLSRVLLESAFFSKPVIATDSGGNRDGVEDGVNGYLVKADGQDIASKIESLHKDRKRLSRMAEGSGRIYEKKFKKDLIVKRIEGVYERLYKRQEGITDGKES